MHTSPDTTTPEQDWNVAFLVRGYPKEIAVQGPGFFMVNVSEEFLSAFKAVAKVNPDAERFITAFPVAQFMWIGVRVRAKKDLEAVEHARHHVEGFIDAATVTIETTIVPKICDVVWLGSAGALDMSLHEYHYDDWIEYVHGGPEGAAAWNDRNDKFRERLIIFYELAAETHSKAQSELGLQLRHSLRMFRYALNSHCYGVEFICKFCALEGLVCGSATSSKKQLLLTRLGRLFCLESSSVQSDVQKLWKYRSETVHTAQAFDNGNLDQGAPLGVHLQPLERLFRAVVVFALDHLHEVETVDSLWRKLPAYTVPKYAIMKRPAGMERVAMKQMLMPLHVIAKDMGNVFEKSLEHSRALIAARQEVKRLDATS